MKNKKNIILIIFFILVPALLKAENNNIIYTWGYGNLTYETLKIVKYVFSINDFKDVWKLTMIISIILGVLSMLRPQVDFLKLPKIIIISLGVWTIFCGSTLNVFIKDNTNNLNSRIIKNIPWAVAYPMSLFSTLEFTIGKIYENASSIPEGINYSNSGFLNSLSIFNKVSNVKIIDPVLFDNVNSYIQECVIPDLENGYKDYRILINTKNIWSYMGNTNPTTILLYLNEDNSKVLKNCKVFYNDVNNKLLQYSSQNGGAMKQLAQNLNISSASKISNLLGISNNYLINSSKNASEIMLQNATINTLSESYKLYMNLNGLKGKTSALYSGIAQSQSQSQMIISGLLGSTYIPILKGILTVILIGLTPMIAIMMLTPYAIKTILGYIMMLFYLATWHLGDVVLNHIILVKAKNQLSIFGETSIALKGLIDSSVIEYINMASSMYWLIPTIGLLVSSGFSFMVFNSLNSAVTGSLSRTISGSANEMGKGNLSFNNSSNNSYSANKFDSTKTFSNGNLNLYNDGSRFDMGNSYNNSNKYDNFNSQMSGNISRELKFDKDQKSNLLIKQTGQDFSFGKIVGSLTKISSNDKDSLYSAKNLHSVNKNGAILKEASQNAILLNESNGNYKPYSGTFSLMGNDYKGDPFEIKKEYNQGSLVKTTAKDIAGNEIEKLNNNNGDTVIKWKSNEDNNSYLSGYIDKDGTFHQTGGNIENYSLDNLQGQTVSYSENSIKGALKSLSQDWSQKSSSIKTKMDSNSIINDRNYNANGELKLVSEKSLFGWLSNKAFGVKLNFGGGAKINHINKDTIQLSSVKEGARSISLSGGAKETFLNALNKNLSNEDKINFSKKIIPEILEAKVNQGLENKKSINELMNNIVENKDNFEEISKKELNSENIKNNFNNIDIMENVLKEKSIEKSSIYENNLIYKDINKENKMNYTLAEEKENNISDNDKVKNKDYSFQIDDPYSSLKNNLKIFKN